MFAAIELKNYVSTELRACVFFSFTESLALSSSASYSFRCPADRGHLWALQILGKFPASQAEIGITGGVATGHKLMKLSVV